MKLVPCSGKDTEFGKQLLLANAQTDATGQVV